MKKRTQKQIAQEANISEGFFCEILAGKKTPSWTTAKILTKITGIPVEHWMENKKKNTQIKIFLGLSKNQQYRTNESKKYSTVKK